MRSTTVRDESTLNKPTGSRTERKPWWVRARHWISKGRARRFRREQFLALPPLRVFAFLIDAANLERTTPRSLRFQLLTPLPMVIQPGQLLEYQWRSFGRTFKMQSMVAQMSSPGLIEEYQQQGPFSIWHHVRRLKSTTGGTWVIDELEYRLSWGLLGTLLDRLLVRRKLEHLFDYRQSRLTELLLPDATVAAQDTSVRMSRARKRHHAGSSDAAE